MSVFSVSVVSSRRRVRFVGKERSHEETKPPPRGDEKQWRAGGQEGRREEVGGGGREGASRGAAKRSDVRKQARGVSEHYERDPDPETISFRKKHNMC